MKTLLAFLVPLFLNAHSITIQILGSGGPELSKRASISYIVWIDGKAKALIDTSAPSDKLITLTHHADYLIVHHAITEHAGNYVKQLHITPPTRIGEVAQKAGVKNLILSHRMKRTYGYEEESLELIRKNYKGNIIWAEDLMKIEVQNVKKLFYFIK